MDLRLGFALEDPSVTIPWGISETELKALLADKPLHFVTRGYLTLPVTVLRGLQCMLGFHFRKSGRLSELEFFRLAYPDQRASFEDFQKHFEAVFGVPTHTADGDEGFPSHEWRLRGATIHHSVFDRFGPEEHMRVRHKK
jgi:hypothetical protein